MDAAALAERANALLFDQRAEDAEIAVRQALRLRPDILGLYEILGTTLMMQGRWTEGWPLMECRASRLKRQFPYPEWTGDPLAGRSILVWGEQGLGDEIQMVRFVSRLRELGASKITLVCHPLHHRAFAHLGVDLVSHQAEKVRVQSHDRWVMLGSLPHRFGVTPETLDGSPYLRAPAVRRGGIGLVERGNPLHPNAQRSLPEGALRDAIPSGVLLKAEGDTLDSLARLAELELLITVDTSWAHMAGALGVPTVVLLPHHRLDCRWMRRRSDTPWYRSLRLVRQCAEGGWGQALAAVRSIAERVS